MLSSLLEIPSVTVSENVPLSGCTRFEIGGPARLLIDVATEEALPAVLAELRASRTPVALIGGGTNLIVSDNGFDGAIVRYTAHRIEGFGCSIQVDAGAVLQDLVDFTIERGLGGLETMTGIPGWVGGAVYGNAGAYGHSIQERVESVRFFDGSNFRDGAGFRDVSNAACCFAYRDSIFKQHTDWILPSAGWRFDPADLRPPSAPPLTPFSKFAMRNTRRRCAARAASSRT